MTVGGQYQSKEANTYGKIHNRRPEECLEEGTIDWMAIIWHQNNLPSEPSSCCDTTMAVKPDIGPSVPKENL